MSIMNNIVRYRAEVLGHPSICNFFGYISVYYNTRMLHIIGKLFYTSAAMAKRNVLKSSTSYYRHEQQLLLHNAGVSMKQGSLLHLSQCCPMTQK